MKFTGILIGSENPEKLVAYYTKVFGKAGMDDGGYVGWQIGESWITVGPHDQVKGKNTTPGRIIWNIETPDVKGQFEKFRAAGANVIREPYSMEGDTPGQGRAEFFIATFADPDGNYFQLVSPMEMPSESGSEKESAATSR